MTLEACTFAAVSKVDNCLCRLNFRLRDACGDDLTALCPAVCKDATKHACGGRALRCLTDNAMQIRSQACRDEVFYFEKMEVNLCAHIH